jgi:hypothetical protein
MTRLPPPEQSVLHRMSEIEVAEMIEEHINFVDKNGRSVHLPTDFVRHYVRRDDDALPTVVAIATAPIVLADGGLLAPDGLDRDRGIIFIVQRELRAAVPDPEHCDDVRVRAAIHFLCDEWLGDVATDFVGKCTIIAAALTIIERSLLPDRPVFFITAGRRGGGKTTTLTMLIMALTGIRPAAAAWSSNEEERRKALLSYFLFGVSYIIWDNIPRGTQISCPHVEKSCTAAFYSDRKLGVSEVVATAASTIHFFTGNNIGPRGDLASRSLMVRLQVDRADPENRRFKHPDPVGWTEDHRAEILQALYTILLGNPMLRGPRDTVCKTRFKMWWRLIGSAIEHAAKLVGEELDFQKQFLGVEEDEEESATLADALAALLEKWPDNKEGAATMFRASDVAKYINEPNPIAATIRDFLFPGMPTGLFPGAPAGHTATAKSVGRRLMKHLDNPVKDDQGRTLALKTWREKDNAPLWYFVQTTR